VQQALISCRIHMQTSMLIPAAPGKVGRSSQV